jgi:hypothetical protein
MDDVAAQKLELSRMPVRCSGEARIANEYWWRGLEG